MCYSYGSALEHKPRFEEVTKMGLLEKIFVLDAHIIADYFLFQIQKHCMSRSIEWSILLFVVFLLEISGKHSVSKHVGTL